MTISKVTEAGFTIQELLVVLLAGSLLLSFSLSLFLFAGKLFGSWEKGLELRRAAYRVVQQLRGDFRKADRLEAIGDSALVLQMLDERRVEYQFSGGSVQRNDVPLSPQDGPLLWISIDDTVDLRVRAESKGKEYVLRAWLTIPQSSQSEIQDELITLREDVLWEALKKH